MQPLEDGSYEALVLDVGEADGGGVTYELALLHGPEKGAVVTITSSSGDPTDLSPLGLGATIVVRDGKPSVRLEPA